MEPGTLAVLALAGLVSGVVNTLAGAGSLITLPALIWAGLSPQMANGTSRVAVLLGSVAATTGYARAGLIDRQQDPWVWVSACLGAVVGSWVSVDIDERTFGIVLTVAMWGALAVVLFKPKTGLEEKGTPAPEWARAIGFFLIGFYGGFLQAGVGYLLLAGFVGLSGHGLLAANARKVWLVLLYSGPALAVFALHGMVAWLPGLALAAGAAAGGWLGVRVNLAWGAAAVRWLLVGSVFASTGRILGWW